MKIKNNIKQGQEVLKKRLIENTFLKTFIHNVFNVLYIAKKCSLDFANISNYPDYVIMLLKLAAIIYP